MLPTLRRSLRAAVRAHPRAAAMGVGAVAPAALFSSSSEAAASQKGAGACRTLAVGGGPGGAVLTVAAYGLDKDTAGDSDRLPMPSAPTNVAAVGVDAHREMGEDAVMVASGAGAAGLAVCDGVGGWRSAGVDPGIVSHMLALMMREGCEDAAETDPVRVLDAAYERMVAQAKRDGVVGSTTACVAVVTDGGEGGAPLLRSVNVGDSGIIVVRGGADAYSAPETVHGKSWNPPPFQLAALTPEHRARGCCSDKAADGAVGSVTLLPGDTVVLGSDGLLDNVPYPLIADIVGRTIAHIGADAPANDRAVTIGRTLLAAAVLSERKVDDVSVVVAVVDEAPRARL